MMKAKNQKEGRIGRGLQVSKPKYKLKKKIQSKEIQNQWAEHKK